MTTPSVPLEDFVAEAQTCDVVLFAGASEISRVVELLTLGLFSHTAMVVVEPETGTKYLWQTAQEALAPDPLHAGGEPHAGAQLGLLEPTMRKVVSFRDEPTWRPLQFDRPADLDQRVWDAISPLDDRPFPELPILGANFISGAFLDEVVNDGPMFCSQLVAYTMQQLELMDPRRPANSVAPSDFSSDVRARPVVPLLGQFLPDRKIDVTSPT